MLDWASPAQEREASQLLRKIHIMQAQQAENAKLKAQKEAARQEAIRKEEERVARLKVCWCLCCCFQTGIWSFGTFAHWALRTFFHSVQCCICAFAHLDICAFGHLCIWTFVHLGIWTFVHLRLEVVNGLLFFWLRLFIFVCFALLFVFILLCFALLFVFIFTLALLCSRRLSVSQDRRSNQWNQLSSGVLWWTTLSGWPRNWPERLEDPRGNLLKSAFCSLV